MSFEAGASRRYPILVIKNICLAAAVLSMSASAHASFQVVSLPGLPVMPVSAPSAIAPRPLSLPSLNQGVAVSLPGIKTVPAIAPSFPTLPTPVIGGSRIVLPSPANPMPVMPTIRVRTPGAQAVTVRLLASVPAPAASAKTDESEAARREKLEKLFDRGNERPRGDEVRHTLPENDLLNEIGIQ